MAEKAQAISVEAARKALASKTVPLATLSDAIDQLLRDTVNGLDTPPVSYALLALGGYGRREMCPGSDVDLQFLVDGRVTRLEPFVEA
ncbi:MAG TPA: hypothetical protein EYN06_01895, partial [Myxococcales bacterium]|nr:hypothetical protein [Myxococcales bacterium]